MWSGSESALEVGTGRPGTVTTGSGVAVGVGAGVEGGGGALQLHVAAVHPHS
jgi:hypothetical protein